MRPPLRASNNLRMPDNFMLRTCDLIVHHPEGCDPPEPPEPGNEFDESFDESFA